MLPAMLNSTRKITTAGVTAVMISAAATAPAQAWGSNEQHFVAGVATTLALEYILNPKMFGVGRRAAPPAPVYYTPAPVYTTISVYQTPAASAFNSYASNERMHIQSRLASLGYYHGSIDGAFGPATYSAVQAYASNTGKLSLMSSQAGAFTIYDGLLF